MSELDALLKTVRTACDAAAESLQTTTKNIDPEIPGFLPTLDVSGVSLLDLKNSAMLSYLHNIALVAAAKVESLRNSEADALREKAVAGSVVQRVVLERGVKGLEQRLSYQLDKSVRAYQRSKERAEDNVPKESQPDLDAESATDLDSELNFKPNARALNAQAAAKTSETTSEKYVPPKIMAAAMSDSGKKQKRRQRLRAVEEYVEEHGDAPKVGYSIGSEIMNHGRETKTRREREKDEELAQYEEANFTRVQKKKGKKRRRDEFGGEDWGMFG